MRIESRDDLAYFMQADRLSLGRARTLPRLIFDDIWRFQRLLRRYEYALSCLGPTAQVAAQYRWRTQGRRLGFTIPPFTFGPGLAIAHWGTIVVNAGTRVGANCRLHACVNIGTAAGFDDMAPSIGSNCYIGPGAKLFGAITIGDGAVIGANAVVNKSFPEGACTIAGIPARIISKTSSDGLLRRGTELV